MPDQSIKEQLDLFSEQRQKLFCALRNIVFPDNGRDIDFDSSREYYVAFIEGCELRYAQDILRECEDLSKMDDLRPDVKKQPSTTDALNEVIERADMRQLAKQRLALYEIEEKMRKALVDCSCSHISVDNRDHEAIEGINNFLDRLADILIDNGFDCEIRDTEGES